MKKILIFLSLIAASHALAAQEINPNYDSTLSAGLGADAYGMKSYYLVILKTGENLSKDKAFIDRCFTGHMANIQRLVDDGKLVVAGPLSKNERSYRGIFILQADNADEVKTLLQTDPAIQEKLLDTEIYSWYGSAALPAYLKVADKIWKQKF